MQILIGLGIGLVIGLIVFFAMKQKKDPPTSLGASDTSLQLLLAQMNELTRTVDKKLGNFITNG
jgi:hypothetical protein